MKTGNLYIIYFVCLLCTGMYSQEITNYNEKPIPDSLLNRITLDIKDMPFAQALTVVENAGGFYLNYNAAVLPQNKTVTLQVKNEPAHIVLNKILENVGLKYVVSEGDFIVLIKNKSSWRSKKFIISGFVTDSSTGEALVGANIYSEDLQAGCTSNRYGFYSMTLPEGNYNIGFHYIGYDTKRYEISLNKNIKQNVELMVKPIHGDTIYVIDKIEENIVKSTELGTIKLSPDEIENISVLLGEKDILRTIQFLPGISQAREADCGYYVRGGNSDQNLILLDEAPVHNAFHLFGFFSVFNTDAIKDVKLIKGSAPPKYGGKISSVLDVQMKEGNKKRFTGNGGVGLIFSRLTVEGPIVKDKSSFIISGRRTYADMFLKLSSDELIRKQKLYFYDFNLKANYQISDIDRVFISGYFGKDVIGIIGENDDTVTLPWGNKTGTIRWNHLFSDNLFLNSSLIFSQFKSGIIVKDEDDKVETSSIVNDLTLKEDFQYFADPGSIINFGLHFTHHNYLPNKMSITGKDAFYLTIGKREAKEGGIFISHEYDAHNRLNVNYGLRYSLFRVTGEKDDFDLNEFDEIPHEFYNIEFHEREDKLYVGFEPRFSATFMLDNLKSVKFGYARNYQNIHMLSRSTSGTPLNVWHPSSSNLKPQMSDQYSAGYFQILDKRNIEMSLEVFYKNLRNQLDYRDGADAILSSIFESEFVTGKGRAYGAEFFLKKRLGRLSGWLGYTLSRSERKAEEINDGTTYLSQNDRTHDLAIIGVYDLNDRITFSGNWVFQTGTPVTVPYGKYIIDDRVVESYLERNSYRMPAYHRLDIGMTYKTQKHGSWNITLYNAYGQKNAYAIYFRENENNPNISEAVRYSLFSIIPSVSYNFNF